MQFHSSSAKHKLSIVALLLVLFALPFAMQWRVITTFDSRALLAGGAVIGKHTATPEQPQVTSNNTAQASSAAGSNFIGAMAR